MSPDKALPCQERLDADCFRQNPAWAKRAFAYRLLHLLTPRQLTRRLPSGLRLPLIAAGVDVPSALILPDGTVVAPGTVLPSTWSPGSPVPIGIIITPGTYFPSGWSAGDPVPEGVIMEPGSEFPEGWTPPDPLPAGMTPAPDISPQTVATGATPPAYIEPWEPGPINQPGRVSPVGAAWWFLDPFDTFEANDWVNLSLAPGTASIVNGTLKLYTPINDGNARYRRLVTDTWPAAFTVVARLALLAHSAYVGIQIRWGTHQIQFYLTSNDKVNLQCQAGWQNVDVPGGHGTAQKTYKLAVTNSTCSVLVDDVEIIAACQMPTTAFPSQMYLTVSNDGTANDVRYEYFGILE